jgi:hypothetical protein
VASTLCCVLCCAVLPAVAGRINHDNYKSWEYEDAHLTDFGWKQAKAVQDHIRAHNIKVDVVIVSPLTRAIETAVGCFGNFAPPLNGTPPLLMGLTEQPGVRPAHPAVGSEGCPPFVCYELCREHLGVHPCDRRHPIAAKQAMFPGVLMCSPEHSTHNCVCALLGEHVSCHIIHSHSGKALCQPHGSHQSIPQLPCYPCV